MSDINVILKSQRIVVDAASSSVSVIFTGPTGSPGPQGAQGEKGDQGDPGVSIIGRFDPIEVTGLTYTFDDDNHMRLHIFTNASGCTVTIPTSIAGQEWYGVQKGAGPVVLVPDSGVSMLATPPSAETLDIGSQFVVTMETATSALVTGRFVE